MERIHDLPPLLVRADASDRIGIGHVMRCLALIRAWQSRGGKAIFVGSLGRKALQETIIRCGAEFVSLPVSGGFASDAMTSILRDRKIHFVVLDGYDFDHLHHQAIRAAGHKLLVIDDIAHLSRYDSDIVLNQNLGAPKLTYHCRPETLMLLGPSYALLRPEFAIARKQVRTVRDFARRILVTLGGADSENITMKVVESLRYLGSFQLEVRVVTGPAYRHIDTLSKAVATLPFPSELLNNVSNMADTMMWAELAITAAGSTCWELACLGVPPIAIVTAENQRSVVDGLNHVGATHHAGWHADLSSRELASIIESLLFSSYRRLKMRQRGRELVDGCGADRVVSALLNYRCARAA
jgi:UDP-2,4-diacetamido-2,4,6-trideoxy-beta-L-altropyranose hydrolase